MTAFPRRCLSSAVYVYATTAADGIAIAQEHTIRSKSFPPGRVGDDKDDDDDVRRHCPAQFHSRGACSGLATKHCNALRNWNRARTENSICIFRILSSTRQRDVSIPKYILGLAYERKRQYHVCSGGGGGLVGVKGSCGRRGALALPVGISRLHYAPC